MDDPLGVATAAAGLLVIVWFLGLTTLDVIGLAHFTLEERLLTLGVAYSLLGADSLISAFAKRISDVNISVTRDTEE